MDSSPVKNENYRGSEFQENLELLRQTHFFSGAQLDNLKVVAFMCVRDTFKEGDFLFTQEEDDGQAFFIISGKAGLWHKDDQGEQLIQEFEAGELVGALALLGQGRRLFSLKAAEDTTCLIVSRDKFNSAIQQFPDLLVRVVKAVVERIMGWEEQFLALRSRSCEACVKHVGVSVL